MKISSAEFVKSVYHTSQCPAGDIPEVSFLGRSNVGKSSLLNSLLQRRALARTSNTPGRTQCINFFLVNNSIHFVDLPGYGYAKVSKSMRADWGKMAEEYLAERRQLVLSIQLIDARHKPTALDIQLHDWLIVNQKPHIVVATKADKLSRNELQKQMKIFASDLAESKTISYSSETGKGREELWSEIVSSVKNY
ncbi:MAG: ribosome biogenesis GTP-binding protein YihA/YsxC [Pyrinomonadaceae bacterium]